jgi:hypothetical protein
MASNSTGVYYVQVKVRGKHSRVHWGTHHRALAKHITFFSRAILRSKWTFARFQESDQRVKLLRLE